MHLCMAGLGHAGIVQRVTGREDTRKFLTGLGFVTGAQVQIISENAGNMIVRVKDSRVAISRDMALHIHV